MGRDPLNSEFQRKTATKTSSDELTDEDELEAELDQDEVETRIVGRKMASKNSSDELNDEDELEAEDEFEDDEFEDDDQEELEADDASELAAASRQEDPFWWTPHLVLGVLLMVGLLGYFGAFNKWLGFLAPAAAAHHSELVPSQVEAPPSQAAAIPAKTALLGAKQILVQYRGAQRAAVGLKRNRDAAKSRAVKVAAKLQAERAHGQLQKAWPKLLRDYSDVAGAAARDGDLGRLRQGSGYPHPIVLAALERLDIGDVSEPVETPFGYHVLLRTR